MRYLRFLVWKADNYKFWRKVKNRYARRWLKALVMYPEQQGSRALRVGDTFCCLGKLCDVVDPEAWHFNHKDLQWVHIGESTMFLPEEVIEAAGMKDHCGTLPPDLRPEGFELCRNLASLNDSGYSWPAIATLVVRNQDAFFQAA